MQSTRRTSVLQIAAQPTFGGGERHVLDLTAGLRDRGIAARIVVPGEGELLRRARELGLECTVIPRPAGAAGFARLMPALLRAAAAYSPAIIHGHSGYGNLLACLTGAALRVPVVTTWHGLHSMWRPGRAAQAQRLAERTLAGLAAAHICVSRADAADLAATYKVAPARITTIPNGVPFPAVPPATGSPAGASLVTVARFEPQKDYETLLLAARILAARFKAFHLDAFGFGALQPALERRIEALGLAGCVRLRNAPHAEIMRSLESYDAFVLATKWEGMPYSTLEALSHGLPVIATAVGGLVEQIEPGVTGELVTPFDPAALAEGIGRVLAERTRYVSGVAARWNALTQAFDVGRMADATARVYAKVLHDA